MRRAPSARRLLCNSMLDIMGYRQANGGRMPESHNVEWKQSWRDEYLEWVCGFANAEGGTIFIGKDDRGNTVGLVDSKRLMEDIPNKIRNRLGIVCDVSLHSEKDGREYICIAVSPSPYPVDYHGKYHVRTGSTKQQLSGNELTRFIFDKTGLSWEAVPVEGACISDFRHDAFDIFKERALRRNRMQEEDFDCTDSELLEKLGLLVDGRVTRAGVLLFHHDPERWLPLCYTKIGRFANDADILYQDEVHGSLIEQAVKTIDLLFTKYTTAAISYDGITRVETYPFPVDAVREMVYNALVHSNWARMIPIQISVYDDRIYVGNQAVLPRGLTVEKLLSKHKSEPYNPLIAQVFYRAGFIESWGRGIEKIRKACEAEGIPMAEFELDERGVMVMLKSSKILAMESGKTIAHKNADGISIPVSGEPQKSGKNLAKILASLTKKQREVFKTIVEHPDYTQEKIAISTGMSRSAVSNHIIALKEKGLIKGKKNGFWELSFKLRVLEDRCRLL